MGPSCSRANAKSKSFTMSTACCELETSKNAPVITWELSTVKEQPRGRMWVGLILERISAMLLAHTGRQNTPPDLGMGMVAKED